MPPATPNNALRRDLMYLDGLCWGTYQQSVDSFNYLLINRGVNHEANQILGDQTPDKKPISDKLSQISYISD